MATRSRSSSPSDHGRQRVWAEPEESQSNCRSRFVSDAAAWCQSANACDTTPPSDPDVPHGRRRDASFRPDASASTDAAHAPAQDEQQASRRGLGRLLLRHRKAGVSRGSARTSARRPKQQRERRPLASLSRANRQCGVCFGYPLVAARALRQSATPRVTSPPAQALGGFLGFVGQAVVGSSRVSPTCRWSSGAIWAMRVRGRSPPSGRPFSDRRAFSGCSRVPRR
jgi:hypothetical protein